MRRRALISSADATIQKPRSVTPPRGDCSLTRLAGRLPLRRISPGVASILALALAWGFVMHATGWAQLSNYAQVRALSEGAANIDRGHWETQDIAWHRGHFYSVKAPGLAAATLPVYMLLDAAGAQSLA